jgi:hypothetical protein
VEYFRVPSSKTCGPFNDPSYESPYDYIGKIKDELSSIDVLGVVVRLVISPGIMAFIIFLLR